MNISCLGCWRETVSIIMKLAEPTPEDEHFLSGMLKGNRKYYHEIGRTDTRRWAFPVWDAEGKPWVLSWNWQNRHRTMNISCLGCWRETVSIIMKLAEPTPDDEHFLSGMLKGNRKYYHEIGRTDTGRWTFPVWDAEWKPWVLSWNWQNRHQKMSISCLGCWRETVSIIMKLAEPTPEDEHFLSGMQKGNREYYHEIGRTDTRRWTFPVWDAEGKPWVLSWNWQNRHRTMKISCLGCWMETVSIIMKLAEPTSDDEHFLSGMLKGNRKYYHEIGRTDTRRWAFPVWDAEGKPWVLSWNWQNRHQTMNISCLGCWRETVSVIMKMAEPTPDDEHFLSGMLKGNREYYHEIGRTDTWRLPISNPQRDKSSEVKQNIIVIVIVC